MWYNFSETKSDLQIHQDQISSHNYLQLNVNIEFCVFPIHSVEFHYHIDLNSVYIVSRRWEAFTRMLYFKFKFPIHRIIESWGWKWLKVTLFNDQRLKSLSNILPTRLPVKAWMSQMTEDSVSPMSPKPTNPFLKSSIRKYSLLISHIF